MQNGAYLTCIARTVIDVTN